MITKAVIEELVNEKVANTDLFLVDVKVEGNNRIFVEVDGDSGIPISACVNISRFIESSLDREQQDFELQVSSPGADSPFRVLRQYKKNAGKNVEITTADGKQIKAVLLQVFDENIEIQQLIESKIKGRKPTLKKETETIQYSQIKQIKVIISFK